MTTLTRYRESRARVRLLAVVLAVASVFVAAGATAQGDDAELIDIFGNLGTAEQYDEAAADAAARAKQAEGHGSVLGQVIDGETGATVTGATVILQAVNVTAEGAPQQIVAQSGGSGGYEFASVPPGEYKLSFIKSGYRTAEIQSVTVEAGEIARNDFPMPRVEAAAGGGILDLDAFVVDAAVVGDMMDALDLRLDSDGLLNVMTAEDFSKFAAGDVAEALKRVSGVNIVEGQFAIIRGLDDRYSSTLYNGAVIPSPDPDRQSVQLDLFPSEVLANTLVAKSFSGELPSNSSGGSINMITHDYPEEFEIELKMQGKANSVAWKNFDEYVEGNSVGVTKEDFETLGGELGLSTGGRREIFGREFRAKLVGNWGVSRKATEGWEEEREPLLGSVRYFPPPREDQNAFGDLLFGELSLTEGRFDRLWSQDEETFLGYIGFGFDIDKGGDHKVDGSYFYVDKETQNLDTGLDGYIPDFNDPNSPTGQGYPFLFDAYNNGQETDSNFFTRHVTRNSRIARGAIREDFTNKPNKPTWWSNHRAYRSRVQSRNLEIIQLNGDHLFSFFDDLEVTWAANRAKTKQESDLLAIRVWGQTLEAPDFSDPATRPEPPFTFEDIEALGDAVFRAGSGIRVSRVDVKEDQWFARVDSEYENDSLIEHLGFKLTSGFWYEKSKRKVNAQYLENPTQENEFFFEAETPSEVNDLVFGQNGLFRDENGDLEGSRFNTNESLREILAGHVGLKTTILEHIDFAGSLRFETIQLSSKNDPFTDQDILGVPRLFPNQYVLFDRVDNFPRGERTDAPRVSQEEEGIVYNDQILGLNLDADVDCRAPVDLRPGNDFERFCVDFVTREQLQDIVNGKIDETKMLPLLGFAIRPFEGLSIRGVYSETVARPSFREMGYYVTEDRSGNLIIGNPLLRLSNVTSYDARIEYTYGGNGDLFAFSIFKKEIENPIERIVLRDPLNLSTDGSALYRTYFNNPSDADLWGIEAEAQKTLDFLGFLPIPGIDFLEFFSVGGNYTWIRARVDRPDIELQRAQGFFERPYDRRADSFPEPPDGKEILFTELNKTRRLFGQPSWIANANISFDQPDWGTRVTLAWFAISDVLDAAGSSSIDPSGLVGALTLDQYIDSYNQLDLIASQSFEWEALGTEISFKFSAKNLTNSTRREIYDPKQTAEKITFQKYKVGRSYSLGVTIRGF